MRASANLRVPHASAPIYCVHVYPPQGQSAWFYLQVPAAKRALIERISHLDSEDLSAFGTVLASGYGDTPPTHVEWAMQQSGS